MSGESGPPARPAPVEVPADFDALYRQYGGLVASIARKILGDPQDAEECCQEVWMKVRDRLDSFEGRGSLKGWIGVVAANAARQMIRQQRKHKTAIRAAVQIYKYEATLAGGEEEVDLKGPLFEAVRSLEGLERDVIECKLADGDRTLDQVAARLDLPRHKVKYAWKKALEALRARLTEWGIREEGLAALAVLLPGLAAGGRFLHG